MFWIWTIGAGLVGYLIGSRKAASTSSASVGLEYRPRQLTTTLQPVVQAQVAQVVGRAMVRASPGLNVRQSPSPSGEIVDQILRGEVVDVITSSSGPNSWWQIRTPRGTLGFALGVNGGGEQNLLFLDTRAAQVLQPAYLQSRSRGMFGF